MSEKQNLASESRYEQNEKLEARCVRKFSTLLENQQENERGKEKDLGEQIGKSAPEQRRGS